MPGITTTITSDTITPDKAMTILQKEGLDLDQNQALAAIRLLTLLAEIYLDETPEL